MGWCQAGGSSTEIAALEAALEEQKAAVLKVEAEKAELQKVLLSHRGGRCAHNECSGVRRVVPDG